MIIAIFGPDKYKCMSSDIPEVGKIYYLEDAAEGSLEQNKAFHALVHEYFRSGCHSYQAKNFDEFRNQIKRKLGAGFEAFVYAVLENGRPVIKDARTYESIPESVRADPDLKLLVRGRLKSWSDYTKKERIKTIDRLISEMHQSGVQTKKFEEIQSGMEGKCQ